MTWEITYENVEGHTYTVGVDAIDGGISEVLLTHASSGCTLLSPEAARRLARALCASADRLDTPEQRQARRARDTMILRDRVDGLVALLGDLPEGMVSARADIHEELAALRDRLETLEAHDA